MARSLRLCSETEGESVFQENWLNVTLRQCHWYWSKFYYKLQEDFYGRKKEASQLNTVKLVTLVLREKVSDRVVKNRDFC